MAVAANKHSFETTYTQHFTEHVWKDTLHEVVNGVDLSMTASDKAHTDANADHAAHRDVLAENKMRGGNRSDTEAVGTTAQSLQGEAIAQQPVAGQPHAPQDDDILDNGLAEVAGADKERSPTQTQQSSKMVLPAAVVGIRPVSLGKIRLDHPVLHILDATELRLVKARSKVSTVAV